ncbi:hypothetical protein [Allohahella sp. A8]|uniref:hypothetical protein n=1 Tax=Allohahella sp. A8 TaxID=3141461 RepID=UPI000C0A7D3A|nr:hypothetical protein [Hahellaceae bacterium]|tara:strand:- start:16200 stop:16706 length:507 start_codon:yes stop_codon:yes gene_type:complete
MPNSSHFRISGPLAFVALTALSAPAQTGSKHSKTESAAACSDPQLQAAADDFRELRTTPGHFDGAGWRPEVDAYDGKKHKLMQKLAKDAIERELSVDCLLRLLGKADEQMAGGSAGGTALLSQVEWQTGQATQAGELLIYNWRGRHDRLVFLAIDDKLLASGWALAYE